MNPVDTERELHDGWINFHSNVCKFKNYKSNFKTYPTETCFAWAYRLCGGFGYAPYSSNARNSNLKVSFTQLGDEVLNYDLKMQYHVEQCQWKGSIRLELTHSVQSVESCLEFFGQLNFKDDWMERMKNDVFGSADSMSCVSMLLLVGGVDESYLRFMRENVFDSNSFIHSTIAADRVALPSKCEIHKLFYSQMEIRHFADAYFLKGDIMYTLLERAGDR